MEWEIAALTAARRGFRWGEVREWMAGTLRPLDGYEADAWARDAAADWIDEAFAEHVTDRVPAWTGGRETQQRMIRSGRWKLVAHHGDAPQLFDLDTDPHERRDLAGDPAHAERVAHLLARVLDGWDPAAIQQRIRARRLDKDVIDAWARHVRPSDAFRWTLLPEHNRLDPVAG